MNAGGKLNRWLRWALIFAMWTLIALAFASQFNFTQARRGYIVTWAFALRTALADWYIYAALSIPALWLARRFHIEGAHWRRSLAVHLVAGMAFGVAWVVLRVVVEMLRSREHLPVFYFGEMFHWTLMRSFYFNLLIYGVIIGASHGFEYYRRYRERELRASELEKLLAQSRLQALQSQLNPHFLFNALNSIGSLMHKDVDAADRMLVRLSELLRLALENVDTQEVPLRDELEFLRRYLEIEQVRFGPRLQVEFDVPDDLLSAHVPNLLLQPLVENAIKHGIAPRRQVGRIQVRAWREDANLNLLVKDNGTGKPPQSTTGAGLGLANTRARLEHLHGERHRLEFGPVAEGGFEVRVRIPLAGNGSED
jgi:signal transduction histidine kinase